MKQAADEAKTDVFEEDAVNGKTQKKIKIFINEVKYEIDSPAMTGAELKALAEIAPENQLFLDAPGPHDDPQVFDDEPFDLKSGMKFYDVPVGNLGRKVTNTVASHRAANVTGTGLDADFDGLETRELPDGTTIVCADMNLPAGWTRSRTRVRFLQPVAFPSAQPDCFFADLDLRLANGAMPMNSGIQQLEGQDLLWFSWHLSTWSPANDNTATYLRFIERRLRDVR